MPWRRKWQSTPVLLPGKSHGQRSLVGYSPWGRKETRLSDFTSLSFRRHFLKYQFPSLYTMAPCSNPSSFLCCAGLFWASMAAQMVKNLPAMQETQVRSLGWEDPLEKGMATHSSILSWKIPWTEEPGGDD